MRWWRQGVKRVVNTVLSGHLIATKWLIDLRASANHRYTCKLQESTLPLGGIKRLED